MAASKAANAIYDIDFEEEITVGEVLAKATLFLAEEGVDSAHLDARLLLAEAIGVRREYLVMFPDRVVTEEELLAFDDLLERRLLREPMAHILGNREFWSLPFRVTSDTLDPRPDSETLIEAVIRHIPQHDKRLMIADFGTGTGCLLLSLLHEYPNAHGLGVDISDAALVVAEENAMFLGISERAHFHHSNWGESVMGKYDVIISNPPYIPVQDEESLQPEIRLYEPHLALFGGADGLEPYRNLMPHIKRLLAKDGIAVIEFGMGQSAQVQEIALANGLTTLACYKDLAEIERCVVLQHAATIN